MNHEWEKDFLKEFRCVAGDGTTQDIPKYELRARIEMLGTNEARRPLWELFSGETDDVTLENGVRYYRIAKWDPAGYLLHRHEAQSGEVRFIPD